jgi:integrase
LADARARAQQILKDAQVGIDPAAAAAAARHAGARRRRNTFGAVAADFMVDHAGKLRTRAEMQRKLDVELLPQWGDRPIADITRAEVKALLREKARQGPIASNRLLALVSKIFAWALDEEIIQNSPAVRLPRYGEELERERSLSADEIKALWPAFAELGYPFGSVFQLMLLTGQCRGEVAGMKWDEIGDDGWRLPAARAKTKVGHLVPLSSMVRSIIDGCPRAEGHVFIARIDQPLQGWSKAKRRVDELAGAARIAPWRLHDLRRTAATQMRSLGIDRLVVSKILGHAEGGTTKVYDRYAADSEQAAAMERWANRLQEIVTGQAPKVVQRYG